MRIAKRYFRMLVDALWWFHFVVVLCVVAGFIVQFFVPGLVRYELWLIWIVIISQFIWFGKCPLTELEHYLRKRADRRYRVPARGCIVEAVRRGTGVHIKDGLISVAGILIPIEHYRSVFPLGQVGVIWN